MAPIRTSLVALGLWLIQAGQTHARAQGYTGGQHPYKSDPTWDPFFSFGHEHPISKDGQTIPNFIVVGNPQILSDRVILTPPAPGNQRAAIWSDHSNHNEDWELHVPFRASGPERAGGSLTFWYTLRGASTTGTSTIYTAKPFEGFALVVDSSEGTGKIRGFLNDGSTDYSIHHHPQSLAFGQCDVAYRNLGRPSDLKILYKADHGIKVELDDRLCFESDKVSLPKNYRFGVSAASAENPDSFEIFGLKVNVEKLFDRADQIQNNDPNHQKRKQEEIGRKHLESMAAARQKAKFEYQDEDAKTFKDSGSQFSDLHLRMQALTHQIAEVQRVTGELAYSLDTVLQKLNTLEQRSSSSHDGGSASNIKILEDKLYGIDMTMQNLEKSLRHEGYKIDQFHSTLRDHHENLPGHIKDAITTHGPRMGFSISILIVFQVMLVIAYVVYKRRRNIAPKKYL
ncbi:hypothetical protein ABW19_dt0210094 [Dactylella cylindrospora]|nr:hypothetical protein ABW19_dt0210094 [Dactylella cylindrospora]